MAREQHYKKEGNDLHIIGMVSETEPDISDWTEKTGLIWIRKSDRSVWIYLVDQWYPLMAGH